LHPGADQRDKLADEEEPEITMPQRPERTQPAAPSILRRNVPARLVSLSRLNFRNGIDNSLLLTSPVSLRERRPSAQRTVGEGSALSRFTLQLITQISELPHFARANSINRVPCSDAISLQRFTT
jgi:hypothetical protein